MLLLFSRLQTHFGLHFQTRNRLFGLCFGPDFLESRVHSPSALTPPPILLHVFSSFCSERTIMKKARVLRQTFAYLHTRT